MGTSFNAGFESYIGNALANSASALLGATHWFALSLAVCLILTMIAQNRIRTSYLIVTPLLVAWYFMDDVDNWVRPVITDYPMQALAVVTVAWLLFATIIGGWLCRR